MMNRYLSAALGAGSIAWPEITDRERKFRNGQFSAILELSESWRPRGVTRLSTEEVKKDISEALDRVAARGERIVLQRENADVAVMISLEDYALFKQLEDRLDLEAIRQSKAEAGPDVTWDTLKKECGL
jgi:PHD/YefM family antitoxin component YafN of YafNO toxin-antitoxin module